MSGTPNPTPTSGRLAALAGGAIILAAALLLYHDLFLPARTGAIYPWSSDTWGHLIKAIYLDEQIRLGHFYPDLFPAWYSGVQMLRYYAPLPYYLLVGLLRLTGDIWLAGNLFLFLTSLAGGLTFLLYRQWLGWFPAALGGVLYMALPDHLRVAFAEGNIPRVLAAALLPLTFWFVLRVMFHNGRPRDFIGLAASLSLVALSHAMMAAIFLVGCGLFALSFWFFGRLPFYTVSRAVLALVTGLLVAGWWLLPSLTGGITELDQQAASEALARFPVTFSLNPSLRWRNPEAYYLGLTLVGGLLLALVYWTRLPRWMQGVLFTAIIIALVSSTVVNDLYTALPFHHLFWPIRFLSFGGFIMLLAVLGLVTWLWQRPGAGRNNRHRWLAVAIVLLLFLDFYPSLRLVHGRQPPATLADFSERLPELQGWRVAAADLSHLGSAPTYYFTEVGGREQVFGWAYQGSITAPLLARVNQAMVNGYFTYMIDRFSLLGADDIVLLRQREIPADTGDALIEAGFALDRKSGDMELYHRDGGPRAYTIPYKLLGVGRGTQNLAMLFPEVAVGGSEYLDDYDQDFLDQFDQLYLVGFKWRDQQAAEGRVRDFLANGGQKVLIDLTGVPNEILSRQPRFLDAHGEPVLGIYQATLREGDNHAELRPFDRDNLPWNTNAPQGLDETLVHFSYPVAEGTALGVKRLPEGEVHFMGLNLVFHAVLTKDPVVIRLLENFTGLRLGQAPSRQVIPMRDYRATQSAYHFSYSLAEDTQVVIPVAHHEGTRVYVDGQLIPSGKMDELTLTTLPAGQHQVKIRSEEVKVYTLGRAASAIGALIALAYVLNPFIRRLLRRAGPGETATHAPLPQH